MLQLVIGNKNYSSWSLRPWLLLKHAGIAFEEIRLPLYREDSAAALRQYSPSGKVPALITGELTVCESLAICEYAADLHPEKNLWPKDIKKRAWARSISSEMHAGFVDLRTHCPMNCRRTYAPKKHPATVAKDVTRIETIWQDCLSAHASQGSFLFGDFSIADAMYAPVVLRFRTYSIEISPAARKYSEAILMLPAMKDWLAAADQETEVIAQNEREG